MIFRVSADRSVRGGRPIRLPFASSSLIPARAHSADAVSLKLSKGSDDLKEELAGVAVKSSTSEKRTEVLHLPLQVH
jgi:hypothetical protein